MSHSTQSVEEDFGFGTRGSPSSSPLGQSYTSLSYLIFRLLTAGCSAHFEAHRSKLFLG